ncbi:MAG: glycosyltransferase [Solobacterium sp.]|nr:glycosyltransferase [Solobacterium sp.]
MTKVTIIVPVYNAEAAVGKCIESILGQEFEDFELLLMDDGSRDGSPAILDFYAQKDSRVKVVHKSNSGVSDTRNMGLDMAQGEYIQFLDADDWMTPDSTKMLVRTADDNNADLVVADFYRVVGKNVSRKGSILTDRPLNRQEYAEWLKESPADYYYGVIWNKLFRRSIIEEHHLRFDRKMTFCEDFIFNLEYVLHCSVIMPLQVPVYYYVKTDGSLVSQNMNIQKIVKMKTSVYQYYDRFFRDILDEDDYYRQRLDIAGYLVSVAGDEMALPMAPGTKKLGEEGIEAYFRPIVSTDWITVSYYMNKVYTRYLNTIALKNSLDVRDIKVFDAVIKSAGADQKQISDYTGISVPMVIVSLERLSAKKLVTLSVDMKNGVSAEAAPESGQLKEEIEDAKADLRTLSLKGFSETEKKQFADLAVRFAANLKDAMI